MNPEYRRLKDHSDLARRRRMIKHARNRATKKNIPFSLTEDDIAIPTLCPYLKIELTGSHVADNAPTLDRIIPERGYVPGNVEVISMRANRIKTDAQWSEVYRVAARLRTISSRSR